jgi:type IX secretion system PorP/SprF family membrane protein
MKFKKRFFILILMLILFNINSVIAQDLHFSQFNRTPLFLNPALSGAFEGQIRVMANFRNQWQAIPVPYNSLSVSADYNLTFETSRDRIGFGVQLITDRAGDGKFTTTMASFSPAYHYTFGSRNPTSLSIGAQVNYTQRSYDPNQLRFDNQFNGDYFDPNIPINEQFDRTQLSFFDFGIGFNYNQIFREDQIFNFGISIQHLNQTNQNFLNKSSNALLQRKFNVYASSDFVVWKNIALMPLGFYQWQDDKYEWVMGLGVKIDLTKGMEDDKSSITFGLSNRIEDAWIPWFHYEKNVFTAQLSYDFNSSPLRIASSSYGGLELSLGYLFKSKNQPIKGEPNFCPYIWY